MDSSSRSPELCIVIPVLNERDNIAPLVAALRASLPGIGWEAILVDDDSQDGTRDAIAAVALTEPRVRLLHRIGRRGLASAFVEGAQASLAPVIAAMDADLQHDPGLLPRMLEAIRSGGCDVAVASRYVPGGSIGDWDSGRATMSRLATRLARLLLRTPLHDPLSGYFMLRRDVFALALHRLSCIGFKILLDILSSLPRVVRVRELPLAFAPRLAGHSKLGGGTMRDFALLLAEKLIGRWLPVRLVMFGMIGLGGLAVHGLALFMAGNWLAMPFLEAQMLATAIAIGSNFVLNNYLTFADRSRSGWRLLSGLLVFGLVCSVGAVNNLGIASLLLASEPQAWGVAGLAGGAMSLMWNYAVGSALVWPAARSA